MTEANLVKRPRLLKSILAGLALTLAVSSPALAATTVKQAGFKVIDLAVPFIAKSKGFFAKNGLDWRYVEIDSGKLGVAALLSGNVQFVDLGMDDIAGLQAQGKDPIGIYSMLNSLTMDLVLSNKAIATSGISRSMPLDDKLKRLKGLTFGITRPGAPTQLFIQYLMQKVGLDPQKDATFVQVGGGQALVSAVKTGRIDGFLLSAPSPYLVQKDKAGTVIIRNSAGEGPPEFKDFAFETISTLKSYAAAHPDVVKAYSLSLNEAQDWMKAHPKEALATLKTYFPDTDDATLKLSFDATVPAMSEHGKLTEAAVENQLTVLKSIGAISSMPSAAEGVLWTGAYNTAP
jgi:NitT/TauT family transport system substrate-binding protein